MNLVMSFNLRPNIFNVSKRQKKKKGRSRNGNPEKLATLSTQDTGLSRTKQTKNKQKHTHRKLKQKHEQHGPYQKLGLNPGARKT